MDSFELNKIAGAVLAAVLVIVASRTTIELATTDHGGGEHAAVGYELPKPDTETAAAGHGGADDGSKAAPAAFDPAAVASLVANADVAKGEKLFAKCKACHTAEEGGANKVGPALWGIPGRAKGAVDGYSYSDALKAKGGNWDSEALAAFLHKPKEYIPGSKMVFAGFSDNDDLANIVAYLNSLK